MPLSGVHHIRNDRASYRCPRILRRRFHRVACQPGQLDRRHVRCPPRPLRIGVLVGQLGDRAQLLRTQRTFVRGGRDLGQRLQPSRGLDRVTRRSAPTRHDHPASDRSAPARRGSARSRAPRPAPGVAHRSTRRAAPPTAPSASTAARRGDRRSRTCTDQTMGVRHLSAVSRLDVQNQWLAVEPPATDQESRSHRYAGLCILRHGVSSGRRRGVGVHGSRAPAPPRRPSRDRGRAWSPPTRTRAPRSATSTRRWPAAYEGLTYEQVGAGRPRRPRPGVPRASRTASRRRSPATWSTPSATWSTSAPTSGSRSPTTSSGTASAHTAPELLDRFAFGMPELYRDEIVARPPRRRARLLPDHRVARAGAAAGRRPGGADRHRGRRGLGRVGRGPRPEGHQPVRRGERQRHRLRPARRTGTPRRWSWRSPTSPASRCRCCSRRTSCR